MCGTCCGSNSDPGDLAWFDADVQCVLRVLTAERQCSLRVPTAEQKDDSMLAGWHAADLLLALVPFASFGEIQDFHDVRSPGDAQFDRESCW